MVMKNDKCRRVFGEFRFFIKHKPFRVVEADKNIGAVIISENLEEELAFKSLNNTSSYTGDLT